MFKTKIKNEPLLTITIFLFIILLFIGNVTIAEASNFYVATTGNNSNDGTLKAPWQNITYAVGKVHAGDFIYLMNGTWINEEVNFDILKAASGNTTNMITITSYNGTPTMKYIGEGSSKYAFWSGLNSPWRRTSYWKVENITILGYGKGIHLRNATNWIINNITYITPESYTSNPVPIGISYGSDTITLSNSTLIGDGWNSVNIQGRNYQNGIWYNEPTLNVYIYNNKIFNNNLHNGIDLNGIITNIRIEGNEFHNIGDSAIFYHGGGDGEGNHNVTIKNNLFYDSVKAITITDAYGGMIENNTIWNISSFSGIEGQSGGSGVYDYIIKNNTIYDIKNSQCISIKGYNIVYDNNLLFSCKLEHYRTDYGLHFIRNPRTTSGEISYFRNANPNNSIFEFTDNVVFNISVLTGNYSLIKPIYYPKFSNASIEYISGTLRAKISKYPMTARPFSNPATVTVSSFNTSLPSGSILADFTANTTNGNNVNFTMSTLKPYYYYLIKKNGVNLSIQQADATGKIAFNNSVWNSPSKFTVMESAPASDDNVTFTIGDLVIVKEHFGEKTSAPYPKYDPNKDGIVDIMDIVYVATKIMA